MWEEIKEYVNIQKALQCCSLQLATFSCSVQMQLQFSKRVDPSQVVIVTQADHNLLQGKPYKPALLLAVMILYSVLKLYF